MYEYVLGQIKKNKYDNNALVDLWIFDSQEFKYRGTKYVNIYFYSREKIDEVELNNVKPIYTSIDFSKISDTLNRDKADTFFGCYEKDKLKGQLKITAYVKKHKKIEVDKFVKIDYEEFDRNKNYIDMLEYIGTIGENDLKYLPKINKDYYICSCGKVNTIDNEECKECGTKLELLKEYCDEEKIEKAYVSKRFDNYKFKTKNKEEEIELFKNDIFTDDIELKKKYITDSFIKELFGNVEHKLKDYDVRKKKQQKATKIVTIVAAVIAALLIIYALIARNNRVGYIKKYCDNTDYTTYEDVDELVKNATCPNIANYLYDTEFITDYAFKKFIDSGNKVIYETFKKAKGKELYEYIKESSYHIENKEYIKYLADNNISVKDNYISHTMVNAIKNDDKELFELMSKLYKEDKWKDASYYLNLRDYLKKSGYEICEYSLIYHKNSNDYTCYKADLLSVDNIKYLLERDEKACYESEISSSFETLGNYMKASGKIGKCNLDGILRKWSLYYEVKEEYKVLEEYLKQYKNSGCDINEGYTTPLDIFMDTNVYAGSSMRNYQECEYHKNDSECKSLKTYYKLLKKYGAKCKQNCHVEEYFK